MGDPTQQPQVDVDEDAGETRVTPPGQEPGTGTSQDDEAVPDTAPESEPEPDRGD
jgi:hypothetical protein